MPSCSCSPAALPQRPDLVTGRTHISRRTTTNARPSNRSRAAAPIENAWAFDPREASERLFPSQERCGHHGLTLVEGACHAIDSTVDGRPIGSFGTAGAFSLSKHAGAGVGGFLAIEHARDLPALERLRDQVTVDRNFGASLGIAGHPGPARAPRAR